VLQTLLSWLLKRQKGQPPSMLAWLLRLPLLSKSGSHQPSIRRLPYTFLGSLLTPRSAEPCDMINALLRGRALPVRHTFVTVAEPLNNRLEQYNVLKKCFTEAYIHIFTSGKDR
jgi:hypothetical protein